MKHIQLWRQNFVIEKASAEVEWLRNLLTNILLWNRPVQSVSISCDNQVALARAKNSMYNRKNKYVCLRYNIVRIMLNSGIIPLNFVKSKMNLVDPLTKLLDRKVVRDTLKGMKLITQS